MIRAPLLSPADWIVAGLGNPGDRYARNRHNIGFLVVDAITQAMGLDTKLEYAGARYGKGIVPYHETGAGLSSTPDGSTLIRVIFVKPMSYMNRSGEPVKAVMTAADVPLDRVIVIHDDMDLEFGRLKVKMGGGHGGHNGLRSLMDVMADNRFIRVRMGIGRPPPETDPVDHVLGDFPSQDKERLLTFLERGTRAVVTILTQGITTGMNLFNRNPIE